MCMLDVTSSRERESVWVYKFRHKLCSIIRNYIFNAMADSVMLRFNVRLRIASDGVTKHIFLLQRISEKQTSTHTVTIILQTPASMRNTK